MSRRIGILNKKDFSNFFFYVFREGREVKEEIGVEGKGPALGYNGEIIKNWIVEESGS
jgi:hypothetical protein